MNCSLFSNSLGALLHNFASAQSVALVRSRREKQLVLGFVCFNLAITRVFDQFNIKQMIRQKFPLITVYFAQCFSELATAAEHCKLSSREGEKQKQLDSAPRFLLLLC